MSGIDEQKLKIESTEEFNNLCACGRCTGVTISRHNSRYERLGQINWQVHRNEINCYLLDYRTTKKSVRKHNLICYNCSASFEGRVREQLIDYFIEHVRFDRGWY